ncbi:chemokine (C-C motif) ligand 14 precursor [Arapaima gigas]
MQPRRIFLLLLLATELWFLVFANNGNSPEQCCFQYFPVKIPKNFIVSYEVTRQDCAKPKAIIFYTKKDLPRCVDPDQKWVRDAVKYLDRQTFQ